MNFMKIEPPPNIMILIISQYYFFASTLFISITVVFL